MIRSTLVCGLAAASMLLFACSSEDISPDDGSSGGTSSGGTSSGGTSSGGTTSSSSSGSTSTSKFSCSLNGSCYKCPTADAVSKCASDGPSEAGCSSEDSSFCE